MDSQGSNSSINQILEFLENPAQENYLETIFQDPEEDGSNIRFDMSHYQIQEANWNVTPMSNVSFLTPQTTPSPGLPLATSPAFIQPSSIPSNVEFPGPHAFEISLPDLSNSKPKIIYDEDMNKVYLNMEDICPLQLSLSRPPPPQTFVRLLPIFSQIKHIEEVVHRCIRHANQDDPSNSGFFYPLHLIRVNNPAAIYQGRTTAERLSVAVPYESPSAGTSYTPLHFYFMCLSSCPGGINRRALQVIVTLECGSEILARRVLNVKVSASPKRDHKNDLNALEKKKEMKESKDELRPVKATCIHLQRPDAEPHPPEHNYTIQLRNAREYEMVTRLIDCLRMCLDNNQQASQATQTRPSINIGAGGETLDFPYDSEASISKLLRFLGMDHCIEKFRNAKIYLMKDLKKLSIKHLNKMKLQNAEVEKIWTYAIRNTANRDSSQSSTGSSSGGASRTLDITKFSVSVSMPHPGNTTTL